MKNIVTVGFCAAITILMILGISGIAADSDIKAPSADTVIVYATTKGKKYHIATCRHLKKAREKGGLRKMSIAEARKNGLTPCNVCKPDRLLLRGGK